MDSLPGVATSLWLAGDAPPERPPLAGDSTTDVAVIGGGIVGVAAALFLAERGVSVTLVEARTIAGAVTGNSTAKVTALHETSYSKIAGKVGREAAAAYAQLNLQGLETTLKLVERHGIECSLEQTPNFLYTEDADSADEIEAECQAAAAAGLEVGLTTDLGLPFDVHAAVRLGGQAALDSAALTRGLAAAAEAAGADLHERSRVRSVAHRRPCRVELENGATLRADKVIIATGMPLLDRGLYFARLRPQMSYAVAAPADDTPPGMYLGIGRLTRSIRSAPAAGGKRHLIVGGEGHKVGEGDGAEAYPRLAAWAQERFGVGEIAYRWSAHDLMSPDGLPMIGALAPWAPRILTATGFAKWGLAKGISAAAMLTAEIAGEPDPKREVFDPARLDLGAQAPDLVKENANVALHFVGDRVRLRGAPRCTHLGCLVRWNEGDETWDCPCHGSRFAADGSVLNGPASAPLDLGD